MESIKTLARLSKYLKRHRKTLVAGACCIALVHCLGLSIPWLTKLAIDSLGAGTQPRVLLFYAALIVAAAALQGVFRFSMRTLMIGASRRMEYELRNDLFQHLLTLSPSYFSRTRTGDIMAKATNDVAAVREFMGPGIMYSLNTIIAFAAAISLMLYIDPLLTAFALIPLPVLAIIVNRFGRLVRERFEQVQQQFSRLNTRVHENLSGIRIVKAYGNEEFESRQFAELNQDYVAKNMRLVQIWGTFHPLIALVGGVGAVIVLWLGGTEVVRGKISLGDFVAFSGYLAMLTWPAIALGWVVNLVQRGAASMGRIAQIMDEEPEIVEVDPVPVARVEGEIEFRNVTFSYDKDALLALKNVSFRLARGKKLAVVGKTGSGKSTLVNLIPRLFRPTSGSILIDGLEIERFPLQTLRGKIGYVPQESFLFSDTIRENIAYGLASARDEQVAEAAVIARMSLEVEEFVEKFDTLVGERGVTLSGGQKQRTAISRAIIIDPAILLLDDPFSSVDAATERDILKGLLKKVGERTWIIVSHRLSSIREADEIIVLEDGSIAERGTHEELLRTGRLYRELHRRLAIAEELETT
ncbi:MAG: ABC transporter ATP-binding protein [Candidatus Eiseniibacteriota bacterium]|nr:MAG: ABC transporter ATP-binding protein [Candidatus Eisenbacteria bacterium]